MNIEDILKRLQNYKIPYSTEEACQVAVQQILPEATRHPHLDAKNIPDFMVGDIVIEIKIKGSKMAIYKQCERYCKFDNVKAIILLTGKTMGLPKTINNKPTYVVSLGRGWL